jgi:hypothetical protein
MSEGRDVRILQWERLIAHASDRGGHRLRLTR